MSPAGIRPLRDVRMADVSEVGGKAASLGELLAAGVSVPDGVVVTAAATAMPADERHRLFDAGSWNLGTGPFAGLYASVLDVAAAGLA